MDRQKGRENIKNIFNRVPKMNKSLSVLKQHEGMSMMTEFSFSVELACFFWLFHKLQEKQQYLSEPESDTEFMEHVAARKQGCNLIFDVFTTADGTALLLLCRTKESGHVNVCKTQLCFPS